MPPRPVHAPRVLLHCPPRVSPSPVVSRYVRHIPNSTQLGSVRGRCTQCCIGSDAAREGREGVMQSWLRRGPIVQKPVGGVRRCCGR